MKRDVVDFEQSLSAGLDDLANSISIGHASRPEIAVEDNFDRLRHVADLPHVTNDKRPSPSTGSRAAWVATCVAALALLVAVIFGTPSGSPTAERADPAEETADIEHTDVILWLAVGVTPGELAEIGDALDENPAVVQIHYVDLVETDQEFRRFFADEPELLMLVEPSQLPTSFEVTLAGDIASFVADVATLPGVVEVQSEEDWRPSEQEHFVDGPQRDLRLLSPFHD